MVFLRVFGLQRWYMTNLLDYLFLEASYDRWVKNWGAGRRGSKADYVERVKKLIPGYEKHYGPYPARNLFLT
jgi:hypothetical protein